uniref:Uncharacterized protein n=1 Tax=Avena sativa TaxID=4498 RepID=A0ACD5YU04_AVESA
MPRWLFDIDRQGTNSVGTTVAPETVFASSRPRSSPVSVPPDVAPAPVTRLASPPIHYCRRVGSGTGLNTPPPTRPRTLGEFLAAAKLRSDAPLLAPPVQRRLMELNFQPRRSSRIAKQPGGLNSEQKAVRNLMRKLGLIAQDEAPSDVALEAFHRMFETPLTDEMIEAVGELYGWTLSAIRGCATPLPGELSGGHLVAV